MIRRCVALLFAAVGFAGVAWGLPLALDQAGQERRPTGVDMLGRIRGRLASLLSEVRDDRILFLGDSQAMSLDWGRAVPHELVPALLPNAVPVDTITNPGMGILSFYFMSPTIQKMAGDRIIFELNPRAFSGVWMRRERRELAGLMPPRAWPEAFRLPLGGFGVGVDRVLLYRGLVAGGAIEPWSRVAGEQARLLALRWSLPVQLGRGDQGLELLRLRSRRVNTPVGPRATLGTARSMLGPFMKGLAPGAPALRILDALMGRLRERGAAVLVYLAPINVHHLRSLGLYDEARALRSVRAVERVVAAHGADLLDLHAILEDEDFLDEMDHLLSKGSRRAPRRVAQQLVPWVRESGAGL